MGLIKRKVKAWRGQVVWSEKTANKQKISLDGDTVLIGEPATSMSRQDALLHAAYLFLLCDRTPNGEDFTAIVSRVGERLRHE